MYRTHLRQVGGSVMLAIPRAILDLLDIRTGTTVGVSIEQGRLIIEPRNRPRFSLGELLTQCDASAVMSNEDHEWLEATPVGRELM